MWLVATLPATSSPAPLRPYDRAPSSPPDMRTLHLLRTPDILCANDSRVFVSYCLITPRRLNRTAELSGCTMCVFSFAPAVRQAARKALFDSACQIANRHVLSTRPLFLGQNPSEYES